MSSSDMNPMNSSSIPPVTPVEELQARIPDLPPIDNALVSSISNIYGSPSSPSSSASKKLLEHHIINKMTDARGDHITTEFDGLENEIENEMNSIKLTMSPGCCIFKVPNILKRHNPKAYVPCAFSIGPYHYGKKHLKATQKIKLKYLHDLIYGPRDMCPKVELKDLIGIIREVEQEARDCYAEPIDHISRDEFVKILVLDGCFLIELFLKYELQEHLEKDDPVFSRGCMCEALFHDLILLENQIPFLVLERLFDKNPNRYQTSHSLSRLVLSFCYNFSDLSKISGGHGGKHILDLLRNSLKLSSNLKCQSGPSATGQWEAVMEFKNMGFKSLFRDLNCLEKCLQGIAPRERKSNGEDKNTEGCESVGEDTSAEWQSMPSATRLREAGIKFRKCTSSNSILDIKFKDGFLEIPQLYISESTEAHFRNLICLEQCLPNCDPIVTCYAMLLDNLINTTEDMEILCESGIIKNWLNTDDATGFFNQLYDNAFVKELYYAPLIAQVKEYCGRRWPRYRAVLMHDYFKHPWALLSVIAAGVLLILTFVQTLFSIIK